MRKLISAFIQMLKDLPRKESETGMVLCRMFDKINELVIKVNELEKLVKKG